MTGLWPRLLFPQDVVAWVTSVPGDALLHVACGLCLPVMELVNGLCYQLVVKCHDVQLSLQVVCLFAFNSDGEGRKRTSSTCSNESLSVGGTSVTPRRISWRQRIFLRVASPMNKSSSAMQQQGLCGAPQGIHPYKCQKLANGMQMLCIKRFK